MSLEPAESAAIRATWTDPESHYDLRWYAAADFVVPMWWIGITDHQSGELIRTEVLVPRLDVPAEVSRWLAPLVGHEAARQLVSLAATAGAAVPTHSAENATGDAGDSRRLDPVRGVKHQRRKPATPAPALLGRFATATQHGRDTATMS